MIGSKLLSVQSPSFAPAFRKLPVNVIRMVIDLARALSRIRARAEGSAL